MVKDSEREYDSPTNPGSEVPINRRSFLQLTGTTTAGLGAVASQTGNARAENSGYGEGAYGGGEYPAPEDAGCYGEGGYGEGAYGGG